MSRVTISDLVADYKYDGFEERYPHPIHHVEIVPRKMVEMIIEYCEQSIKNYPHTMVALNAGNTKDYAESLLKQFEEDENDKRGDKNG